MPFHSLHCSCLLSISVTGVKSGDLLKSVNMARHCPVALAPRSLKKAKIMTTIQGQPHSVSYLEARSLRSSNQGWSSVRNLSSGASPNNDAFSLWQWRRLMRLGSSPLLDKLARLCIKQSKWQWRRRRRWVRTNIEWALPPLTDREWRLMVKSLQYNIHTFLFNSSVLALF